MIAGLDSSFDAPSPAQADAARAAGVTLWSGYLALPGGGRGLAAPWTREQFEAARRCGSTPIGFCTGWDDPVGIRQLAAEWNVRACLDDEAGIRGGGYDRQAWCDAAGAGIYGNAPVHGVTAAFHILAAYPGFDPGATWSSIWPRPPGPCGWQWQGTHMEFGASVDRGWYDDWFGAPVPQEEGEVTTVRAARPDGGEDLYTLIGDHVEQTVVDFGGAITFRSSLPGSWSALLRAGYRGTEAFVQGLGADVGHTAFEATVPAGTGTWILTPKP